MTSTRQAQQFGVFLVDAMNRRPHLHLPPYHQPTPIDTHSQSLTAEQAEHDRQGRTRIWDWDEL